MWWHDLLWGLWNGLTAWIVFFVHVFGGWGQYAVYDAAHQGNWYDVGFLLGAGSLPSPPMTVGGPEQAVDRNAIGGRVIC